MLPVQEVRKAGREEEDGDGRAGGGGGSGGVHAARARPFVHRTSLPVGRLPPPPLPPFSPLFPSVSSSYVRPPLWTFLPPPPLLLLLPLLRCSSAVQLNGVARSLSLRLKKWQKLGPSHRLPRKRADCIRELGRAPQLRRWLSVRSRLALLRCKCCMRHQRGS